MDPIIMNTDFSLRDRKKFPSQKDLIGFRSVERYRRTANAEAYRENGDPIARKRYLTLGFFAINDCHHFDQVWNNREEDSITLHQVI